MAFSMSLFTVKTCVSMKPFLCGWGDVFDTKICNKAGKFFAAEGEILSLMISSGISDRFRRSSGSTPGYGVPSIASSSWMWCLMLAKLISFYERQMKIYWSNHILKDTISHWHRNSPLLFSPRAAVAHCEHVVVLWESVSRVCTLGTSLCNLWYQYPVWFS